MTKKQSAYELVKVYGFYGAAKMMGISGKELSGMFHEKTTSFELPKKTEVCHCQHWEVCEVSGRLCEDRYCQVES